MQYLKIAGHWTRGTHIDDIIERQRKIVPRHIRGENEHGWAAVYDTFVQDDRESLSCRGCRFLSARPARCRTNERTGSFPEDFGTRRAACCSTLYHIEKRAKKRAARGDGPVQANCVMSSAILGKSVSIFESCPGNMFSTGALERSLS